MRQYIALSVVVLIAIFIFTQIEWSRKSARVSDQAGASQAIDQSSKAQSDSAGVSFSDLRVGGVSGMPRRKKTGTVFSSPEQFTQTTAATSSSLSATSTPFQAGSGPQGSYSGVNVQFSKPGSPTKKLKSAASTTPERLPRSASDSSLD